MKDEIMNKEKKICRDCIKLNEKGCPHFSKGSELTRVNYMNSCSAFQPDDLTSSKDKLISPYKLKLHLVRIKKKFKNVQEALTDLDLLIKQIDKKI